jgi:hypothetical protein
MTFDKDAWQERAAIQEYDGGLSRFRAETEAAKAQGVSRWEAIHAVAGRVVSKARDQCEAMARARRADDMPGMQSPSEEKE